MSERTPYKRETDRRMLRAKQLTKTILDRAAYMGAALARGEVPAYRIADDAARLDAVLAELDTLADLARELPGLPQQEVPDGS